MNAAAVFKTEIYKAKVHYMLSAIKVNSLRTGLNPPMINAHKATNIVIDSAQRPGPDMSVNSASVKTAININHTLR